MKSKKLIPRTGDELFAEFWICMWYRKDLQCHVVETCSVGGMDGDKDAACQALSIAAAATTPFPGQDEARKALAALK